MRVVSGTAKGTILNSIEDINTRPTLDRVKESLFNIINKRIDENTIALDLFAGSGAIGIEFLSRGAKKVYLCDKSFKAIEMINKNLLKTKLDKKAEVINCDYKKMLNELNIKKERFDIIYLDPPYKDNITIKALNYIEELNLLKKEGIIIVETDEEERDTKEIKSNTKYKIYDLRKYGRAHLIFLTERGK